MTIVFYDIASNKLRNKIDKCMKGFGTRIQFSVFLCRLDAEGVAHCRFKLEELLERFACEKEPNDSIILLEQLNPNKLNCILGENIRRDAPRFMVL